MRVKRAMKRNTCLKQWQTMQGNSYYSSLRLHTHEQSHSHKHCSPDIIDPPNPTILQNLTSLTWGLALTQQFTTLTFKASCGKTPKTTGNRNRKSSLVRSSQHWTISRRVANPSQHLSIHQRWRWSAWKRWEHWPEQGICPPNVEFDACVHDLCSIELSTTYMTLDFNCLAFMMQPIPSMEHVSL